MIGDPRLFTSAWDSANSGLPAHTLIHISVLLPGSQLCSVDLVYEILMPACATPRVQLVRDPVQVESQLQLLLRFAAAALTNRLLLSTAPTSHV